MTPKIRNETPSDAAAIEAVTIAAFLTAPHTSHTEQFIVGALRDAGALTMSLVAELDGVVVGHVAVSSVSVTDGSSGWFGVGPLSVLPKHQGRGIGSLLMHEALQLLRERGAAGCVVLGDPAYYKRFGFRTEPTLLLPSVPPEYFQAVAFQSAPPCGTVAYHEAFSVQS
ncbi:N-acetyltransferase [Ramlibacter solisilvae]|uniref:GNAT family N-acetyltransferase n=1 Tax=Ramlibacter tataouinensis TaxID=94132 RepID=UPI0009ED89FE|nr:N-acetyltransferase [Ramlibacter tataouinensis]